MEIANILSEKLRAELKKRKSKVKSLLEDTSRKATFVIGAGISCSAGLPGWEDLLKQLLNLEITTDFYENILNIPEPYSEDKRFDFDSEETLPDVFAGTDLLEIGEYCNVFQYGTEIQNFKLLKESKYENTIILNALIKQILIHNKSFNNLKQMCDKCHSCEPENQTDCILNRSVGKLAGLLFNTINNNPSSNVITYNYDNTFEFCLEKLKDDGENTNLWESLYDGGKASHDALIHIYHPHGYLNITDLVDEKGEIIKDSEKCILTESSYYEMEQYQYGWENNILASALNDNSCIFFGFSGNDYNFKRILKNIRDVSFNENEPHHYIVVTIDGMVKSFADYDYKTEQLSESQKTLLNRSLAFKEMYWNRKNIQPIWTTIEELPNLIEGLCP